MAKTGFSSSALGTSDHSVLQFFSTRPALTSITFSNKFRPRKLHAFHSGRAAVMSVITKASSAEDSSTEASSTAKRTDKSSSRSLSIREKVLDFVDKQAGYLWLLGPVIATSAVVLPSLTLSLADLLLNNYWLGLGAVFGLDLVYILAADAFFVLADKAGHYHQLPGKPSPWIGPWEFTGYPKGLPYILDYITYAGVGVSGLALLSSIFLGKFATAVAAFGPYLALIFVQAAYERLLCNDRLPTYPLVAAVYAMYRFKQLARAMELFVAFNAGPLLVSSVRALMVVWTLYLTTYLFQLPWMYCTWNSNRVS